MRKLIKIPVAERAPRHFTLKADEVQDEDTLDPQEALTLLKALEAPVAPVETMIEDSVAGRYQGS